MLNAPKLFFSLMVLSTVSCFGTYRAHAQEKPVAIAKTEIFDDFESGNYDGWTLEGNAFGTAPASDKTFPGKITGFGGKGFACTLDPKLGTNAIGKVTSKEFTIDKPFIDFKIGGGRYPKEACLNLIVDGKIVRTETGNDSPQLRRVLWDVSNLQGKKARLEIVDTTAAPNRGYVMVDSIRLTEQALPKFRVVSRFHQRVKAVLSKTIESATTTSGVLTCYASVPPTLETQKLVSCTIKCREFPEQNTFPVKDAIASDKKYIALEIPLVSNTLSRPLHFDVTYVVDLYHVNLVPGTPEEEINAPPLETDLKPTPTLDYDSPKFEVYLKASGLKKRPSDSHMNFAYRVFRQISDDLAKRISPDAPPLEPGRWKASLLSQPDCHSGSCGFHSIQFTSVLRANGIPSRLLVGRWAKNTEGDYGQFHVRSDFYDPSIGWIPVDQTFGYHGKRDGTNPDANFGLNGGDFITMHLNTEVSPEGSRFRMPIHQFEVFGYRGTSPFQPKITENWTVTKL